MSEHNQRDQDADEPQSRRGALIAMIVVVVMVAGCIWIAHVLTATGKLQDCVMSGRNNCAPITPK